MVNLNYCYRQIKNLLLLTFLLPVLTTANASLLTFGLNPETAVQQEEYLLYQKARTHYFNKAYDAAEILYKQSLEANPIFFPSMIGLADIAFIRNRINKAEKYLEDALDAAPNSAIVQTAMGKYYYSKGDHNEAELFFKKAIVINADNPDPHAELAALYLLQLNRLEDSVKEYKLAIKLSSGNLDYYYGLSVALSKQQKRTEAIAILEQAAKIQPDNPFPLELKAQLLAGNNQFNEAIDSYQQALAMNPESSSYYWALGNIYLAQNELPKALDAFDQFLSIKPGSAVGFIKKGIVYSLQNDNENAEKTYLAALEIDSELSIAYNNLAHGELSSNSSLIKAINWAKKAIALEPKNPLYLDTLASLYKKQGQLRLAKITLEKAIESNAAPPEVYYHLGIVYSELGDIESAKRSLSKALSLSREFSGANDAQSKLDSL